MYEGGEGVTRAICLCNSHMNLQVFIRCVNSCEIAFSHGRLGKGKRSHLLTTLNHLASFVLPYVRQRGGNIHTALIRSELLWAI